MSKHSIRIGGHVEPERRCSPSSASTRLWRRRSARRRSWSSASSALRSASSRMRRFSPRSAARSSTGPPRRLASASEPAPAAPLGALALHDEQRRDRHVPAVVLQHELLGDLGARRARPRWPGRTTGGRRARRRAPGTPARWRRRPSTATATASNVPTDSLATRRRSSSERTALQAVALERRLLELLAPPRPPASAPPGRARSSREAPARGSRSRRRCSRGSRLLRDVADARRLAALDVVVQARAAAAPPRLGAGARAEHEHLREHARASRARAWRSSRGRSRRARRGGARA